jgi:glyoxylase-like metal-dependent hydrolase (beta-lactamase superfamily II)
VYRVPLPLPGDALRAVNVYVIEATDGLTLIDAGWATPASRHQLEASLRVLGHGLRDIRRFLVTHLHQDHYSQAVVLRDEIGCTVSLGAQERTGLELIQESTSRWMTQIPQLRRAGAEPCST